MMNACLRSRAMPVAGPTKCASTVCRCTTQKRAYRVIPNIGGSVAGTAVAGAVELTGESHGHNSPMQSISMYVCRDAWARYTRL
jgi:hypothetical protein